MRSTKNIALLLVKMFEHYSSLVLRPHCLTEVGLGALLSRLPWRCAIQNCCN